MTVKVNVINTLCIRVTEAVTVLNLIAIVLLVFHVDMAGDGHRLLGLVYVNLLLTYVKNDDGAAKGKKKPTTTNSRKRFREVGANMSRAGTHLGNQTARTEGKISKIKFRRFPRRLLI